MVAERAGAPRAGPRFRCGRRVHRPLRTRVSSVLDGGEGYVEFEWIGARDYLGERGKRSRGANVTSLDAIMRVTLNGDSQQHALLVIDWKYTERYGAQEMSASRAGTDRVATYRARIEADDSPFAEGESEQLFYELYEQLMRQTLLAASVVADPATPETTWLHLLVIPAENHELRPRVKKAAPLLLGQTVEQTWRSALKAPTRYRVVTPPEIAPSTVPEPWQRWCPLLNLTGTSRLPLRFTRSAKQPPRP